MKRIGKILEMKRLGLAGLLWFSLAAALLASAPQEVVVSNITDQAVNISTYTFGASQVTLNYGTSTASMTTFVADTLSNTYTHYYNVTGLSASTTYYFQIISNGVTDNNSGNFYSFTTFTANATPPNQLWYGNVLQIGGSPTANGAIVLFQLKNGSNFSTTASIVNTDSGYAYIDDTQFRNPSGGALFGWVSGQTMLVRVQGGNLGELTTSFVTSVSVPQSVNFTLQANTQGPVLSQQNPASGSSNVGVASSVFFRITDNNMAVSQNSLNVSLGVTPSIVAGIFQSGYSGSITTDGSGGFFVTINHTANFAFNTAIQVSVNARDVSGNLGTAVYSFNTVVGDQTAPVVNALSPLSGAINVALNANVSMNINDTASGVSLNTIRVTINGTLAVNNGAAVGSPFPATVVASGLGFNININPDVDFAGGALITVLVSARDVSNNLTSTSYSFTTLTPDTTAPTTSAHSPARGASGVLANASIIVHITDAGTGVSLSSIVMTVSGNIVTPVITGTTANTIVTYTPGSPFTGGTTVSVTIAASDIAGNAMTTDSYQFGIVSASAFIAPYAISVPTIFDPGVGQTTELMWPLAENKEVTLKIYDLNGQSILQRRFLAGTMGATAGINNIFVWDGRDDMNRLQATGIYYFYLISIEAGQQKVISRGNIIIRRTR